MGKRRRYSGSSSESSDIDSEDISLIIKRLKKRVRNNRRQRSRFRSSVRKRGRSHSLSSENSDNPVVHKPRRRRIISSSSEESISESHLVTNSDRDRDQRASANVAGEGCAQRGTTTLPTSASDSVNAEINDEDTSQTPISEGFLNIFGEDPHLKDTKTFELHPAIASRWQFIIQKGLTSEQSVEINSKYQVPSNVQLNPPDINPEIASIMSLAHKNKDTSLVNLQKQIGLALLTLGHSLGELIITGNSNNKIVDPIWDSARVLANTFHEITEKRKQFILPLVNYNMKVILEQTETTKEFLFGGNLTDNIKAAKSIESTSKNLKPFTIKRFTQYQSRRQGGGVINRKPTTPSQGTSAGTTRPSRPTLNDYRPIRHPREARQSARGQQKPSRERYRRRY